MKHPSGQLDDVIAFLDGSRIEGLTAAGNCEILGAVDTIDQLRTELVTRRRRR